MNTTSTHKDKLCIVKEKSNNLLSDGENSSLADLANDISNADSTLDLSKDYIYNSSKDINISDNGIVISKSLVINGNGHTIDAKGAKRIFEINASNIILKNIIFTNGRHNSGGGAIFIASDFTNITFENCDFHDNSAFIMGGAIYAGSTIKIINCNFTNNQLNGSGSSSDARRGGAVYIDKNDSLILYSQFNSNNAQYGGALFIHGSNLTLSYCNFTSNVASIWGGAINDKSDVFSNYILKCRFISNSALQGGSAFNLNAQNSHIDGCYFENNIVTRSDYSDGCGGVVRSVASGTLINSSTFVNNKNTLTGAVFLQADSSYNFVDNCTFTNNEAFYGGAVGIFGKNSKLSNSRINAQSMTGSDKYGAVYVSGTNNEIVNCTFTNCVNNNNCGAALYWEGDSGILSNSTFSNNGARYGGAVVIMGSKISVDNCSFLKNTANNHGGALYVANNNINITNCYFADNKASLNDGGAIYFLINTKNSIVDNCKFINNYAKWIGSAIACFGSNMTFKNSYFKGNNNTFASGDERYGGVIGFRNNGNSKIINCTIEGSRNYYGGAIKIFSTATNIEIYNSTFHSNTAFDGGAIECDASGLKVVGCDFDGNYALDNGGSVIVRASNSAFIKCNFSNGYVRDHDGGAIELIPGHNNLIIDECRFIDNYAQWIGSAIGCFGDNVQINNSYFKGNKNAFRQDSSTNHWYGGALSFRTSSNNKIFNCTFEENQNYAGGAIRVFSGGNIQILNSSFINNVARSYGGAFYSDIGIIIINCSFINNTAQEYYGGAVYSYGGSTNIANSLFVGNTAKSGSAFFGDSTGHVIRDSIFLNNTATATGFIISSSNGNNRVDANYNWFGNVVGDKSVKPNVYSGIKLTRWYFLDIDVNEQFLYTNGTSNITFSLNRYYNSEEDVVIKGDFKYPDIVKLNITSRDDMFGFRNITLDNNKEYPTQTVYIPEIGVYNITATYMGVTARNSVYYVPPDSFTALNRTIGLNYNNNLVLNHSYRYYDEYDFLFLKTGIIIKKPISIDGNGTTIDGKNKVRIFYVESDNVNLTNLNFVNGYADNGGAVYWKGDYGSLNLCNFTNNQANALSFSGGALYWEGNYGLINNTNFKNNSANKYSSSDAGDGGALAIKGMHVAVDYCNFTENNCANCGAAIVSGPTQYINITNSIFSNNKAKTVSSSSVAGVAGAIYMESSDFIIYNCTFKNNFASYWGGAIRASAKGSIISSIFLNNTSPAGSAVYANAGGVNISDCIILNNKGGYAVDSDASNRITANNNWWGNTLNNQKTKPSIHSRVSISNWYFLDIDTSGKYFLIGETCNVTYRLDQITTSGGVVTQRKLNNIFPIEFNFTATIGDLDKYYAILDEDKIINGSFVSDEVGICTISVTALGVTASTKVYYVPPDSFMALNMTIERNYGTNLNLTHGYQYYQDYDFELLNTGVIINKHINITGNGHTLNAKNKLRVFQLSADNVHIDGINYINGYSTANGGLIHVTGKNLVLSNSNFTGGSANRYSGAVHIDAKNATIINSTFTNNNVRVTGKNYYGGGALAVSSVSEGSSLIGCKFFNNYAYMSGGAILWDGPNGAIKDTYFEGNNAKTFDGGAIQLRGNAVNMVIDNVTAYKNRDGGYGSAISSFAANTLINNSRFVGNDYNNARSFGGTVHLAGSNSVFVNSYFENNRAYNGGAITTLSSNSIIKNITFINNRAVKFGGAIHVQDSPSNVDVSNCTFIGNYAGHTGGALRVTSTNAFGFKLTNSTFKDNHAYNYGGAVSIQSPNAIINNTYYDNNYVNKHDGGALDVGSNNVIVDNSTFNNNRAIFGGGVVWYKANGKLINSVFTNNFATVHDGGGLCAFSGATNLYVYNVTMNNNRAKYMGSAIHSDATGTTIVNSSFDHNTNTGNDYGGTLAFYKTNVHIIGCNLTNNNNYYGGAIYTRNAVTEIFVEKCLFVKNYARTSGGAIHITGKHKLTLLDSTFIGNSAKNYGGDIIIYGANSYVENCNFINGTSPIGGSIYIAAAATVKDSNFTGSSASNRAGAIYIGGLSNILNCNFNDTRATNYGGAIFADYANSLINNSNFTSGISNLGGAIYINKNIQSLYNIFNNNYANNYGGAIYVNAKNAVLNSSQYNENHANKAGGAIYLAVTGNVYDSNFTENTANTYGGAIYVASADSKLIRDIFNYNNATVDGGAVYVVGKNVLINQSVFNHNGAVDGSGIYWSGDNGKLHYSVVDNHTTTGLGAVYVKGNNLEILLTNMSFNTAKNGGALYIVGNNANMDRLNLINNTGGFGGALYVNGRNPTVTSTNFTNNRANYGAGMFVGNDITLNPSNFTNNVASRLGGAGYSYGFIDHIGTTLTYENWTTQTDNFYSAYVKLLNDTIFVGQKVILQLINETYTGNVTLEIGDKSYNTTWINVTHRLADVSDLPWGIYSDIHAVYYATGSSHNEEFALVDLTVKRYPVNVTLIDNTTTVGGKLKVKVNESLATQNITIVFENGNEYTGVITSEGYAVIQLDNLIEGGDYNVTLIYSGDDNYDIGEGIGTVHIDKLNATPSLKLNWTYVDGEFIVILPDDATGNVNITVGSVLYEAIVNGNQTTVPLENLLKSNVYNNVKISYSGDGRYNACENITVFEVYDYPVDIVLVDNVTVVNSTLIFFIYPDGESDVDITGNISFIINGKRYTAFINKTTDESGSVTYIAEVDISGLYGGDYINVVVSYDSNNTYYHSTSTNVSFSLTKLDGEIIYVGPEILDLDRLMKFNLTERMSGNISFVYNGRTYNATLHDVVNGTEAIIDASTLPKGIYELVVWYNGDGYFKKSNTTVKFVVKDLPEIKLNNTGDVYGNVVLNVNITSNVTGIAYVYVDGMKYAKVNVTNFTGANTVFNINLNNISAGNHTITVEYLGDEIHFNNTQSFNLFINKANSVVNITNVVNATYNTTSVLINFTVINRTSVYINVTNDKGEMVYYNFTDKNHIIFSNLDAGEYLITVFNQESLNYNSSLVSKYFTVFKANSTIDITNIVNGTYNDTNTTVNFNVENRTIVTVIVYKNGTNEIVYNNTNFNGNIFTIGGLEVGIYNITISNNETGNYNAYTLSKLFEIYKSHSKITIVNVTNGIYNTTNATVKFNVENRTNVSVIVYKNGTGVVVYNNTNFTGDVFTIGNLSAGIYNITITNQGNESYFMFNASALFEVYKAKSFVNITDIVNGTFNTTNATVKFNVVNKTNVTIIVTKNGSSTKLVNLTDFEGNMLNLSNLGAGVYNITIINNENENFTQFNVSALFEVYKAKTLLNIADIINATYNTTNVTVKYNVVNLTSVKIIIIRNGTDIVVYENVSSGNFTIDTLAAGVYNITIINEESDNYTMSKASGLFEVYKAPSVTSITSFVNVTYNTTSVEVSFDITNRTKVNITIKNSIGVVVYTNDDFDGNLFVINTLDAGNYNITITNMDNENYTASSDSILFTVFKATSSLNIIQVTNSTYKINQSVVTLNVVNKTSISYIIRNAGGIVVMANASDDSIVLDDLPAGEYNITVINNENKNYLGSSDSAVFEVIKSYSEVHITEVINGTLDTSNTTVKFDVKVPTNISIIVRDDKGNVVYNNSDFKGNVFSIGGLPTGVYNITISNVETDNAYASNDSTVFKVVVPTTIPSEDISRGYNSPYDYVAVFTDEFGNILNNTNVSMIVDGKVYNLTTDENGVAYLNDTLAVGKHEILLVNPVSGENRTHIVTIVERLQENKDIVMDFCDGTYYSVRAYGDDAKPIAGVTVTITVNGVSYDVVTNADGYALLKIRLNPKTYTITAEWKDYKINKIVVRQTLKAKSVKVKKSANKFKYSASLKWSNGKPIVGEIITFKFKGKTYKAKTNKKGIAKITFNKKVLSKLKVGKNYKINVTYNHVDSGYTSVNSIIKKIKVTY